MRHSLPALPAIAGTAHPGTAPGCPKATPAPSLAAARLRHAPGAIGRASLAPFLALALPRMRAVHKIVRAKNLAGDIDWNANMRSLWFDLAGAPTVESVRRLLAITTPGCILYGSDFPYAAGLAKLRAYLAADPELAPHADAILAGNAQRLFGLTDTPAATKPAPTTHSFAMTNAIFRIAEIEVKPEFLDAYLALWRATGEPELLAKARTLGDTITRVQTPEGRIPTFWTHDTLGAPLYDWLNCMGSSAAALLELDDAK